MSISIQNLQNVKIFSLWKLNKNLKNKHFLIKKRNDIIITKTGGAGVVVTLEITDYVDLGNRQLNDTNYYEW